jgi:hypothetical protein
VTDPKVTLHDVSVEGTADPDGVLQAIEAAVMAASHGGATPSLSRLRASITNSVPNRMNGGDA